MFSSKVLREGEDGEPLNLYITLNTIVNATTFGNDSMPTNKTITTKVLNATAMALSLKNVNTSI